MHRLCLIIKVKMANIFHKMGAKPSGGEMIEVTESAQKKIQEYIENNKTDLAIRVFLAQGG